MRKWRSIKMEGRRPRALSHGSGSKKIKKAVMNRRARREAHVDALVAKRQAMGS